MVIDFNKEIKVHNSVKWIREVQKNGFRFSFEIKQLVAYEVISEQICDKKEFRNLVEKS